MKLGRKTHEANKLPQIGQPAKKRSPPSEHVSQQTAHSLISICLRSGRVFFTVRLISTFLSLFHLTTNPTVISTGVHHTASPLPQQRLCSSLASLFPPLPRQTFIPFLSAFWTTVGSNFSAIPSLRLDKYLLLIRYYVASSFTYLHDHSWDVGLLQSYLSLIGDSRWGPLTVGGVDDVKDGRGMKVPDGLRYHVLDVWLDGLAGVAETMHEELVREVMKPVQKLAEDGKTKVLRTRAKGVLGDERLAHWLRDDDSGDIATEGLQPREEDDSIGEEWEGFED